MSSSFLETIQAVEQPPGDREEEHCDTEINKVHRESPCLLDYSCTTRHIKTVSKLMDVLSRKDQFCHSVRLAPRHLGYDTVEISVRGPNARMGEGISGLTQTPYRLICRLLKQATSKAAASEGPRRTLRGTLRV